MDERRRTNHDGERPRIAQGWRTVVGNDNRDLVCAVGLLQCRRPREHSGQAVDLRTRRRLAKTVGELVGGEIHVVRPVRHREKKALMDRAVRNGRQDGRVVDRRNVDRESLREAGIAAAVGRAAIIVKLYGNRCRAIGVARRCEG